MAKKNSETYPVSFRISADDDRIIQEIIWHPDSPYKTRSDFLLDAVRFHIGHYENRVNDPELREYIRNVRELEAIERKEAAELVKTKLEHKRALQQGLKSVKSAGAGGD